MLNWPQPFYVHTLFSKQHHVSILGPAGHLKRQREQHILSEGTVLCCVGATWRTAESFSYRSPHILQYSRLLLVSVTVQAPQPMTVTHANIDVKNSVTLSFMHANTPWKTLSPLHYRENNAHSKISFKLQKKQKNKNDLPVFTRGHDGLQIYTEDNIKFQLPILPLEM